jgi:hypothetical protein
MKREYTGQTSSLFNDGSASSDRICSLAPTHSPSESENLALLLLLATCDVDTLTLALAHE